jgi:hypothetical protein
MDYKPKSFRSIPSPALKLMRFATRFVGSVWKTPSSI